MVLILTGQFLIGFVDFSKDHDPGLYAKDLTVLQNQVIQMRKQELARRVYTPQPFNPNYITDAKGKQLGLSLLEIDRLLAFRSTDKFVNTAKEFQQVTKISDSLLQVISPFFKFPDWVVKRNIEAKESKGALEAQKKPVGKQIIKLKDLNLATADDFQSISGIGTVISKRIVNYRSRLQGFSKLDQLSEVWNLTPELIVKIQERFELRSLPNIQKTNVNTATFKEVLSNPYIDYELCKKIFNYRSEVAELQSIDELKNIAGFPIEKYDRIVIYLEAK
ncbi:hypothetical protein GCM10011416_01300 [Polaribacter pacificus]|uniref:DNA uptake protein ComE n=1 Tax=Polaribacter pacificus TaxID=1775173 RepID=A0A917MB28_9FLAO|nr:hypothetical protein GCM10011416_01300 [Polaribacter pacificus]